MAPDDSPMDKVFIS